MLVVDGRDRLLGKVCPLQFRIYRSLYEVSPQLRLPSSRAYTVSEVQEPTWGSPVCHYLGNPQLDCKAARGPSFLRRRYLSNIIRRYD